MQLSNKNLHKTTVGSAPSGTAVALTLGVGLFALMPSVAMAAPWDAALLTISDTLQGSIAKAVAVIAVVVLGFMAMLGKLEWMTAGKVVMGIVIVFSAAQIVNLVAPGSAGGQISNVTASECKSGGNVWIPKSESVSDNIGVVSAEREPYCVTQDAAPAACAATVKTATVKTDATSTNRARGPYYNFVAGADTCS